MVFNYVAGLNRGSDQNPRGGPKRPPIWSHGGHRRELTPFEPGETRRNVVVEGVDVYALLHREFRIGAVRLSGSEPTLPCRIPSAVAGKTGFAEAYHGRGGIRAEVLSDGIISIGDFIQTDLSK